MFFFSNLSLDQQLLSNDVTQIPSKMASQKVEICQKKKKSTPSTNIPLLSLRKSEQKSVSVQNSPIENSPIKNSRIKMNKKTFRYKKVPSNNCFHETLGREMPLIVQQT